MYIVAANKRGKRTFLSCWRHVRDGGVQACDARETSRFIDGWILREVVIHGSISRGNDFGKQRVVVEVRDELVEVGNGIGQEIQ